jgi:hypothetical protein
MKYILQLTDITLFLTVILLTIWQGESIPALRIRLR